MGPETVPEVSHVNFYLYKCVCVCEGGWLRGVEWGRGR